MVLDVLLVEQPDQLGDINLRGIKQGVIGLVVKTIPSQNPESTKASGAEESKSVGW